MTDVQKIVPVLGNTQAVGSAQAPGPSAQPRFQELLERLQKLAAEQRQPNEVESPEDLRQALRTADDGFVAAMDLRRQLEEAFRKHLP